MAPSQRTWFDDRGLVVSGEGGAPRRLELFAGALHYWRVPAERWRACLQALRGLGLTAVESYAPWRVHEPTAGAFSWRGQHDVRRFCDLAGEAGLAVILRVGPAANAELTHFGFPEDVLADPAISARTSHGSQAWLPAPPRAFPIPSYASAKLHERVARWYRSLGEQVAAYAAPAGPLVALGVDNEAQLFFRRGAYDLDYHPDAVAQWAALHPQWPEPPRAWAAEDAARCLAWVRFKRAMIASALGRFSRALDEAGFSGVARLHNLALDAAGSHELAAALAGAAIEAASGAAIEAPTGAAGETAPSSSAAAGTAPGAAAATATDDATAPPPQAPSSSPSSSSSSSAIGFDSHGSVSPAALRRSALRSLTSHPLPLVLECGVGDVPWFPPASPGSDLQRALSLLAAGARGLSFYMAVERERWVGGLLAADGAALPESAWAAALLAALGRAEWPSLRRRAPLAILTSSLDDDWAVASCLVDPITPFATALAKLPHGELAAEPSASHLWLAAVEQALERVGVPYDVLPASATADQLAAYRAVVAPFSHHIPRQLFHTLRELAEAKRTVVVLGPTAPTHDEHGAPLELPPLRRVGKMRPGSLTDLEGLASDLAQLAGPPPSWQCPDDACTLSLFAGEAGVRALFLCNDGPATTASLTTSEPARFLVDALTGERIPVSAPTRVACAASSIRFFLVES